MASSKAYFGLSFVPTLLLAIFPFTNWIFGIIHRFMRKQILWGILQIIPVTGVFFYFLDLISIIVNKDLKWLA